MDKRKHVSTMSNAEIRRIYEHIAGKGFKISDHAKQRMTQKRVSIDNLKTLLSNFSIVECHNNVPNHIRVLVRNEQGCCAVLQITTKEIITAYWNATNDNHATLDKTQYKWNVDLTKVLPSV